MNDHQCRTDLACHRLQVWGELYHRMAHMRDYPPRRNAADSYVLCPTLQHAAGALSEPSTSFPRHGHVTGGVYHGVLNCSTNLVNVRLSNTTCCRHHCTPGIARCRRCWSDTPATVQKPRVQLSRWLQHSTQAVAWRSVASLLHRLEHHTGLMEQAKEVLKEATFLEALFSDTSRSINPALLTLVHAYSRRPAGTRDEGFMSAPLPASLAGPTVGVGSEGPLHVENGDDASDSVGDVFWLFDKGAATPYLAEVFTDGLPDNRLPHVRRRTVKGGYISRVLGADVDFVRVVADGVKRVMFTQWCVLPACLPRLLSSLQF